MLKSTVCLLLICFSLSLYAEQVTLKNGDRLTGTILNVSDKKLTIKTEHAGTVTIDWDAVRSPPGGCSSVRSPDLTPGLTLRNTNLGARAAVRNPQDTPKNLETPRRSVCASHFA